MPHVLVVRARHTSTLLFAAPPTRENHTIAFLRPHDSQKPRWHDIMSQLMDFNPGSSIAAPMGPLPLPSSPLCQCWPVAHASRGAFHSTSAQTPLVHVHIGHDATCLLVRRLHSAHNHVHPSTPHSTPKIITTLPPAINTSYHTR